MQKQFTCNLFMAILSSQISWTFPPEYVQTTLTVLSYKKHHDKIKLWSGKIFNFKFLKTTSGIHQIFVNAYWTVGNRETTMPSKEKETGSQSEEVSLYFRNVKGMADCSGTAGSLEGIRPLVKLKVFVKKSYWLL